MKVFEIKDRNYSEDKEYPNIRRAARAVINDEEGNILVETAKRPRIIMLPGGKIEEGESVEDCVKRECKEECGLAVEPTEKLFAIKEYYKDIIFYTEYEKCLVTGKCAAALTDNEKRLGLKCEWISTSEAQKIAEELERTYADGSELEGMHRREKIAFEAIASLEKN